MIKVFVGGSRHASKLNSKVQRRLDNIVQQGFPVLVGDANGADKAVQQYLHDKQYQNVEVFCSGGYCRNNIGKWKTRNVPADVGEKGAEFYSAKDRIMAQEASVGLMIWDGKSVGTILNVLRLLNQQKVVVIYSIPDKNFLELRSHTEWNSFIGSRDHDLRKRIEKRAKQEPISHEDSVQMSWLS